MQNVTLADRVNSFTNTLRNKNGHQFLYWDFDALVSDLKQAAPLSQETIDAIKKCVDALMWEAGVYQGYQLWAIRCNQCAAIISSFLVDKEVVLADIERQQDTFVDRFIWSFLSFPEVFDEYCEKLSMRPERARKVAALCFEHSDTGRRPHITEDEEAFYSLFNRGFNLAEGYFNSTKDYSAFQEWFRFLDPSHIEQIIELVEDCGGNDYHLLNMLEDTLVKQLKLLGEWLEGGVLSFIEYWRSTGIVRLLELVDDGVFFSTLQTLATVKANSEVRAVIEYYTNDDESHIQEFANQLLKVYDDN